MQRTWMWLNLYGCQVVQKKTFLEQNMLFWPFLLLRGLLFGQPDNHMGWSTSIDGTQLSWISWFPAQNNPPQIFLGGVYLKLYKVIEYRGSKTSDIRSTYHFLTFFSYVSCLPRLAVIQQLRGQEEEKGLKVAFFQKVRWNLKKKNIPKSHPELEI